ncbi:Nif3-like dinuclear metal center hexameric protein [Propioniciclava soli]|uniref:Nif3-like dinuclear metal center hexameric protein n=1 Tax=Propioniciclava soli TaxID=2775081 RepID=UPI001E51F599
MSATVAEIAGWLDGRYPPGLAEDWDQVGLSVGEPDAAVSTVLLSVDVTDAVVAEAMTLGAELIVSHHPLLLRGVHGVRGDDPKGRVVTALIRAGIAVYTAHTNADAAPGGVADCLADVLGLVERRPLVAAPAGGGLGRIGRLPEPRPARAVARALAAGVPATAGGVKLGGDPERLVSSVAVLGGAGDSMLDDARAAGVDCYVTGDLRHHPAQDFLAHADAPVLIDVPHWAAEWTWLPAAEAFLQAAASERGVPLTTHVSTLNTDPWALRLP